jgi:sensor histidine kinase YesM
MAPPLPVTNPSVLIDDSVRRDRARERLYVFCQVSGWGVLLLLQLIATLIVAPRNSPTSLQTSVCMLVIVVSLGLLLSHYSRVLIARWKWRQLGWRALVPRVLGISFALSLLWTALVLAIAFAVLRLPWTSPRSPWFMAGVSLVNGTALFVGWMCIYFIYHLFDRFNRSEIERLELVSFVKEAELRALKSQVNPHFIFNSLNSLRALIDENPARAREAVTQLANLLRYSLQSGQLETVPFEEELRIVNDYLSLEQVRHEERLRVRLDIDPATLALPIPPMLLQTLVENAVKYGIATQPEGGEIAIVARRENDLLRLQVRNPGEFGAVPAKHGTSTGVGLRNAAERLRLLFGDRATLHLRASTPASVVAEAVLPLQPVR